MPLKLRKSFDSLNNNNNFIVLKIKGSPLQITLWKTKEKYNLF